MANVTVIEPARGLGFPDLRELWEHRDLTYFLVRRDLAIRYKQSIVGVLWAVLPAAVLAAVFSVFLGVLAKVPSESGVPTRFSLSPGWSCGSTSPRPSRGPPTAQSRAPTSSRRSIFREPSSPSPLC